VWWICNHLQINELFALICRKHINFKLVELNVVDHNKIYYYALATFFYLIYFNFFFNQYKVLSFIVLTKQICDTKKKCDRRSG